jgi:ATPase subunit of ABC transporter with duplicated ATPase domains
MALVSLNAVRKSFGSRTVLDGLDFAIEPNARVGVVGANGSGKSTMLKVLAGRAGLSGDARLADALREGRDDYVLSVIRSSS